jgi:dCTP deaminase
VILSDRSIRDAIAAGDLLVVPEPEDKAFQPASLEVHLGEDVELNPWIHTLSHLLEWLELPGHIACQLTGKSSLARLGLQVHTTAGWIDPGFRGQIVLELVNMSPKPIVLLKGSPVAQLVFQWLDFPADRPYGTAGLGSHYQGQTGNTPSYLE